LESVTDGQAENPHPPAENPHPPAWKGIEGKGIEGREEEISVPPTVRRKRTALLADDTAWMAEVKARYAQIGIDAEREAVKAQAWLLGPKARGRKFTRQFFLNWLNRADSVVKPPPSFRTQQAEPIPVDMQRNQI
jgi:hypothetical protein